MEVFNSMSTVASKFDFVLRPKDGGQASLIAEAVNALSQLPKGKSFQAVLDGAVSGFARGHAEQLAVDMLREGGKQGLLEAFDTDRLLSGTDQIRDWARGLHAEPDPERGWVRICHYDGFAPLGLALGIAKACQDQFGWRSTGFSFVEERPGDLFSTTVFLAPGKEPRTRFSVDWINEQEQAHRAKQRTAFLRATAQAPAP